MRKILVLIGLLTFFLSACGGPLEVEVTFETDGGSTISPMTFNEESTFALPNDPTKEGFAFDGWYLDETLNIPFSVEGVLALEPEGTLTIYASWTVNQYTITFDTDGGSEVDAITKDYNNAISAPSNPTKEGYTFSGWSEDVPSMMPAENQTLIAIWTVNQYTITFDTDGGSILSTLTFDYGTELDLSEIPTKENFVFMGWSLTVPETMPAGNITLKAIWEYDPEIVGAAPIYQGMEVSNESGVQTFPQRMSYRTIYQSSNINDEIPTIDIPEQPDFVYFANRNETILVSVVLDNPDSQVILRFKLNGVIYQSFQFEEGSNSELLIVKVNAGDVSGIKELTIDEIKYVENVSNLIKDAEFEGDRTITMGVTYDHKTEATISNINVGSTSYTKTITITDTDDLMTIYENPVVFYLFDGTSIIYTQILTVGNNTIDYPYLHPSTSYEYAIASTYDLLDGNGPQVYIASQNTFTTENIVSITNITPTQESISFELDITDIDQVGEVTSIELYLGETLIESLSDLTVRTFEGLLSNNNYEIKVTYTYNLNDGNGEQVFNQNESNTTLSKATPNVEITNITPTQESISFELDITDTDQVGEVTAIELYQGDTLIESLTDLTLRTFNNLTPLTEYLIKVTYEYNIADGLGNFLTVKELNIITTGYRLMFNTNDDSLYMDDIVQQDLSEILLPLDLEKAGHTFDGWYLEEDFSGEKYVSIDQRLLVDETVHAKWTINQYTITYIMYENYEPLKSIPLEEGETIVSMFLGGVHSSALTSTGRLFMWGSNDVGQLGDGIATNRLTPLEITSQFDLNVGETIVSVSLGANHSSALTSKGRLFMWGYNEYGQLGDGTTTNRFTPTEITTQFDLSENEIIVSMFLGGGHSSALTSTGRLFMWGYNFNGGLGDGTTTNRDTPAEITSQFDLNVGETIVSVSLGAAHSSALTSTGRLFMWGRNVSGNLGDGTTTDRLSPTEITSQFDLNEGETIVSLSLGYDYSSALTSTGRVFAWGYNIYGQLGDGTTTDRFTPTEITAQFDLNEGEIIVSMFLGSLHSYALTSTGRLFMWGYNFNGGLGDGTTTNRDTPAEITSQFDLNVGETIVSVSLGANHSSALTSKGRLFMWGRNDSGNLGDGTTTDRLTPIITPFKTVFSTTVTHHLFNASLVSPTPTREGYTFDGWYNDLNFTTIYEFTTMPAENVTLYAKWDIITFDITYVLDGGNNEDNPVVYNIETSTITLFNPSKEGHTFGGWFENAELTGLEVTSIPKGTIEDIILYAKWTINSYTITYITYDNYEPLKSIPLEEGETIISISLGWYHSSALTSTGRLFMWGWNGYGQLGDGTTTNRFTPTEITSQFDLNAGETIVSLSLGGSHSSALTSIGRLFMWGSNDSGELGDVTTERRFSPIDITSLFGLTDGENIVSVSLGSQHSSALTSTGRLFMWGYNDDGQLGDGTTTKRTAPTEITSQFDLNVGESIVSVSLRSSYSSVLTSTGRLFMWGDNNYGRLGDGTINSRTTPIEITKQFDLNAGETIASLSLGVFHSSILTSTGRLFLWGYNFYGQLGVGTRTDRNTPTEITSQFDLNEGEIVVSVSLGWYHSSALTSTGRLFMWGGNVYGQLGDSTTTDRITPTEITSRFGLNEGETIVGISLDAIHSSALTSKGRLFMWGGNVYGQIGDGTTTDKITLIIIPFNSAVSTTATQHIFNVLLVSPTPAREGYTFDGWYTDFTFTTTYVFTTMPAEDLILYARWIEVESEVLYMTLVELSAFDGKDGADAYIAYNGVIYDVTNNPNWPNGVHRGYINAGQDVTQLFQTAGASHGDSNITNLPIVGYLEEE